MQRTRRNIDCPRRFRFGLVAVNLAALPLASCDDGSTEAFDNPTFASISVGSVHQTVYGATVDYVITSSQPLVLANYECKLRSANGNELAGIYGHAPSYYDNGSTLPKGEAAFPMQSAPGMHATCRLKSVVVQKAAGGK